MYRWNLFILLASVLHSAPNEIAVVVQAGEVFSPQAWQAMEAESGRIARQAGLKIRFVEQSTFAGQSYDDLVVFRVSGRCQMDSFPALLDERGPYAWALTAGGDVLPFGEVRCDRVRESIKPAMNGSDHKIADQLLGRALGRVITHELYHMLAKTKGHAKQGVAKHALSARQLIADSLDLGAAERRAMRGRRDFR